MATRKKKPKPVPGPSGLTPGQVKNIRKVERMVKRAKARGKNKS